jgi:arsenate reductase (thioredoxin)
VDERAYNALFLCTGNSARSILAEAIVNHLGNGRFKGFSAGSHPKGAPHSYALDLLRGMHLPVEGLRSKSWDEFAIAGAPGMDFVFTVCDDAAGEACPVWPGQPMTAHWGIPDPAAVEGTEIERRAAFRQALPQPAARQPRQDVTAGKARCHRPQAACSIRCLRVGRCRFSNAI